MEYRYKPQGVCSREMIFEIEEDIVKSVKIIGGCARKHFRSFQINRRNENKRSSRKAKRNSMWI